MAECKLYGLFAILMQHKFKGENMKIKKSIAIALTSAIVMLAESLPVNAVQTGHVIDNDPIAAGYGSYNGIFSYMSASGCYNGDARRVGPGEAGASYSWLHPTIQLQSPQSVNVNLQVYLNHSTFTDPNAKYMVCTDGANKEICFINQNTAPSTFGPTKSKVVDDVVRLQQIQLVSSGKTGTYTGADAISISYVY